MTIAVSFTEAAQRHLLGIYEWIVDNGSAVDAERFVEAIIDYCESLADMPGIGVARDDIRPGVRTVGFRRRVVIAFAQIDATHLTILGVFYGGQDYERHLAGDA